MQQQCGGVKGKCNTLLKPFFLRNALFPVIAVSLLSGCAVSDGSRTLVIVPNPIARAAYELSKYQIRDKDAPSYTLFSDDQVRYMSETGRAWLRSCRDLSYNKSKISPVSGFRLNDAKPIGSLSARGYDSIFDFYAAFNSRKYRSASVVESIQIELLTQRLPIFLEFESKEGRWRRSSYDPATGKLVTQDVNQSLASHTISFEQVITGYEDSYKIYGVTMTVRDVATNTVIAENTSIAKDLYNGFHNRYSLIPDSRRCTYPEENNFVGAWLTSLVQERDPLRNVPYDGYDNGKRPELIRWAERCSPAGPENQFTGVDENASGRIVSIDQKAKIIEIEPHNKYLYPEASNITFHVPSGITYTVQGGELSLDELPVGESIDVWYENCRRVSGKIPEAAFVKIWTPGPGSRIPKEKLKQKKASIGGAH